MDVSVLRVKYVQLTAVENSDDVSNDILSMSNTSEQWVVVDCHDQNV